MRLAVGRGALIKQAAQHHVPNVATRDEHQPHPLVGPMYHVGRHPLASARPFTSRPESDLHTAMEGTEYFLIFDEHAITTQIPYRPPGNQPALAIYVNTDGNPDTFLEAMFHGRSLNFQYEESSSLVAASGRFLRLFTGTRPIRGNVPRCIGRPAYRRPSAGPLRPASPVAPSQCVRSKSRFAMSAGKSISQFHAKKIRTLRAKVGILSR